VSGLFGGHGRQKPIFPRLRLAICRRGVLSHIALNLGLVLGVIVGFYSDNFSSVVGVLGGSALCHIALIGYRSIARRR